MRWVLIIVIGIAIVLLVLWVRERIRRSRAEGRYDRLERRYDADIRKARSASVKQSRAVHLGGIAEQMAPLLPGFPYDPKDCRWAGQPIDMIVFDGLEAGGDVSIVLLEVKTGTGSLNANQRRVRDAADAGRVKFCVHRPDREWDSGLGTVEYEAVPAGVLEEFDDEDIDEFDGAAAGWEDEIEDEPVASDPPAVAGEPA